MSDTPRRPTVINDRYELHRKLARGGMSDVYLARDVLLGRPVAVKVLFPEYAKDPTFVERFRREAQAAANLNHPNIVAVYDWGQQGGTYFLVMEYVEGRTLSEIVRSEGPLHPTRAAEVAADVAAALAFAHRNGVIHRDIKPGNILITSAGLVKVADFGIAQAVTSGEDAVTLTQAGSVMGTATYFSPEQAQGKPVDPRSDLYSLGCVLYEMLTTRPPFQGDTPVAIAYKHVQEAPVPPSAVNPAVPSALEAIDLELLAKEPADRYPSAEDLRADLMRFIDGRRVSVDPALAGAAAGMATAAVPTAVAAGSGGGTVVAGGVPPDQYPPEPGDGTPPRKRRSGAFLAVMIILLVLLAGILVVLGLQLSKTDEQITVPEVTRLPVAEATARLAQAGFKAEVREETNTEVAVGIVFDQTPPGGSKADKDSTVVLRVSSGVGKAAVPNVVGRTQAAAVSLLENAGFVAEVVEREDDSVDSGQVIEQNPAANTQADKGSIVQIVVSVGPGAIAVPNVEGLSATAASNQLGQLGFSVDQRTEASDGVDRGDVISTEPAAGTKLEKGATVTLVVSSGPATTTTSSTTSTTAPTTSSSSSSTSSTSP